MILPGLPCAAHLIEPCLVPEQLLCSLMNIEKLLMQFYPTIDIQWPVPGHERQLLDRSKKLSELFI